MFTGIILVCLVNSYCGITTAIHKEVVGIYQTNKDCLKNVQDFVTRVDMNPGQMIATVCIKDQVGGEI